MIRSRFFRVTVALLGVVLVMLCARLTSAYYTSTATATTDAISTGSDPNQLTASCKPVGTSNSITFSWSPITGATKYQVFTGLTSPGTTGGTPRGFVTTTSFTFMYQFNTYNYGYVVAYSGTGTTVPPLVELSTSNSVRYIGNNDKDAVDCQGK